MYSGRMDRIVRHLRAEATIAPAVTGVLIVSDDPLLSLDLEMALTGQGLTTRTIGFSAAATTALPPHMAVILDIEKPAEVTACLLNWLARALAPVMVVSSFEPEAVTGLPPGTVWYAKPLRVDDIVAGVLPQAAPAVTGLPEG